MKLQIEPPFVGQWKHAYVVRNKENRNMVCLFNSNKDRTTIALARYRMAVKLGRMLRDDEQVDHIDNDKTNDDINNLQILSAESLCHPVRVPDPDHFAAALALCTSGQLYHLLLLGSGQPFCL